MKNILAKFLIVMCVIFTSCRSNNEENTSHEEIHTDYLQKNSNKMEVKIVTTPLHINAGDPVLLTINISKDDKAAELEIVHEKELHLIVVNDALTWFHHLHPQKQGTGKYTVTEIFPEGGKYLLYADFKAVDDLQKVSMQEIFVSGDSLLKPDMHNTKWISETYGLTATLVNGDDFRTNRNQKLEITVEKDGKHFSVQDFENYLGATAHIVVIANDDKEFLHIHPGSNEIIPILGEVHFTKSGLYRVWVQFQISEKIHTVDFTVQVGEGMKESETDNEHQHNH